MTYEEACQILGVDAGAPEKDVRRAYAKLVKKHKPELDPEGFRRVRDAYEVVSRPAWRPTLGDFPPPAAVTEPTLEPAASFESSAEPPIEPPSDDDELAPYFAEFDAALGEQASPDRLRAVAQRAIEAHPHARGAHQLVVEAHEYAGDDENAAKAMRAAADAGLVEFVELLAMRAPRSLTASERAEVSRHGPFAARVGVAGLLVEEGHVAEAIETVERLLHEAEQGEGALYVVHDIVRFAVLLFTSRELARARAFCRSLSARLPTLVPISARNMDPALFLYLRELAELAPHVDDELVRILARVLLDRAEIEQSLARFELAGGSYATHALGKLKREMPIRAPSLANRFRAAVGAALGSGSGESWSGTSSTWNWKATVALLFFVRAVFGVAGACDGCGSTSPTSSDIRDLQERAARATAAFSDAASRPEHAGALTEHVLVFCSEPLSSSCTPASAVAAHVYGGRCSEAQSSLRVLEASVGGAPTAPMAPFALAELGRAVRVLCGLEDDSASIIGDGGVSEP